MTKEVKRFDWSDNEIAILSEFLITVASPLGNDPTAIGHALAIAYLSLPGEDE